MALNEPLAPVVQTGITANSRGYTPNTAYGEIFSGLAETLKNGLTAYDESKKAEIEQAAYRDVEGVVQDSMPPDLSQGVQGDIEDIQIAAEQGQYSDIAMRTKLDQAAKRRIAANPSYAPYIQRQFAAALGTNTANDMRTERLRLLEEASLGGKEKYKEKVSFYNSNIAEMGTPEFRSAYLQETGTPFQEGSMEYDERAARKIVARQKAVVYTREQVKAEAEADAAFAPKYGRQVTQEIRNKTFSMVVDSPLGQMMSNIDKAKADGVQGPEKEALLQQWGMLRTAYEDQIRTRLSDTTDPGIANLSTSDKEAIIKSELELVNQYEKMIISDEYGLLKSATRELANHKEDFQHRLMKGDSMIMNYSYLKEMVPEDVALSIWNNTEQKFAQQELQEQVAKALTVKIPRGTATLADMVTVENELGAAKPAPGVMLDVVTSNLEKVLTNPDISDEQLAASIQGIFKKENLEFLNTKVAPDTRLTIFNRLIKPGVIERLKASGDMRSLKALETWGTGQFIAVTSPYRDTLMDAAQWTDSVKVAYNDGKFTVSSSLSEGFGIPGVLTIGGPQQNPITAAADSTRYQSAIRAAADMNVYIDRMTPAWEATGQDKNEVIKALIGGGIGEEARQGALISRFWNAIGESLSPSKAGASTPSKAANEDLKKRSLVSASGKNGDMPITLRQAAKGLKPEALDFEPEFSSKLDTLIQNLAARGVPVRVAQGNRSIEEQNELYAQGRTKPGKIVTKARGGKSNHNHRIAADLVPEALVNQPDWDPNSPLWNIIGEEAEALGLDWGGNWKSMVDRPHVQLKRS